MNFFNKPTEIFYKDKASAIEIYKIFPADSAKVYEAQNNERLKNYEVQIGEEIIKKIIDIFKDFNFDCKLNYCLPKIKLDDLNDLPNGKFELSFFVQTPEGTKKINILIEVKDGQPIIPERDDLFKHVNTSKVDNNINFDKKIEKEIDETADLDNKIEKVASSGPKAEEYPEVLNVDKTWYPDLKIGDKINIGGMIYEVVDDNYNNMSADSSGCFYTLLKRMK